MRIPAFIPEEQVADYISDETGFLVVNYCLSEQEGNIIKLFIITKSGHPPTQKVIKNIIENFVKVKYAEITTYAGIPLINPRFILNHIEDDSYVVLLDVKPLQNDYYCINGKTDIEAIKKLLNKNIKSNSFDTILKALKA